MPRGNPDAPPVSGSSAAARVNSQFWLRRTLSPGLPRHTFRSSAAADCAAPWGRPMGPDSRTRGRDTTTVRWMPKARPPPSRFGLICRTREPVGVPIASGQQGALRAAGFRQRGLRCGLAVSETDVPRGSSPRVDPLWAASPCRTALLGCFARLHRRPRARPGRVRAPGCGRAP